MEKLKNERLKKLILKTTSLAKSAGRYILRHKYQYLFIFPAVVWYIVFCYIPMAGILLSVKEYRFSGGIFGSPWADPWYKWYYLLLGNSTFWTMLLNTVKVSLLKLVTGFISPIILALLLNEVQSKRFKKTVQTISYLPHFVSWIVIGAMMQQLFTPYNGQGPLNKVWQWFTGASSPQYIIGRAEAFYPVIILTNIWKGIGWGSIIYLAAISSVSAEVYEAAVLDGCGRFGLAWYVTIPSIIPTIGIQLILSLGGIVSAGYDQIYIFKTAANYEYSNVLDIYIIENGLQQGKYALATAAQLFQSFIALFIVLAGNFILKKTAEVSLW